jgi:dipeptidase D
MKSKLLKRSVQAYTDLYGSSPQVGMFHAGLECGTIGAIYGGMDLISLGAIIENPQSPAERLNIPSIERVWRYLATFF